MTKISHISWGDYDKGFYGIIGAPGPGKYQNSKKKNPNKDKINEILSIKPGFNSSDTRQCLKKGNKAQSPGPGSYIDINGNHFIANQKMNKYHSEKGFGNKPHSANSSTHFGSKSMRFSGGFF